MTRSGTVRAIIISALLGAVALASYASPPPPLFYAVVADTQKPDNDPFEEFAWAVGQINDIGPDFVLMPGDLTDSGTQNQYEHFMKVASTLRGPVRYALGNHEAVSGQKVYRSRFTSHTKSPAYYHVKHGGWHLVVLDSARFLDDKLQHDGAIDPEQLGWLKRQLDAIGPEEPIVLSLHHPMVPHDGLKNAEQLLSLFDEHYLLYTVTAHFHRNRHHQDQRALHHITTGALSFSTDKKNCGIGYRWIATVGHDLWTAWVETTDKKPFKLLYHEQGPGTLGPGGWRTGTHGLSHKPVCVRVRYQGEGLRLSTDGHQPIHLPAAREPATAFIPMIPGPQASGPQNTRSRMLITPLNHARVHELWVYETAAKWQRHRLKQPGEVRATVRIHAPEADASLPRGRVAIAAIIQAPAKLPANLAIDGRPVEPDPAGLLAPTFQASGLQTKSFGFKNHLFANGQFVAALPTDRDVTEWERFLYPIPAAVWNKEAKPWYMLTAGTPEDGSGADPEENNEDYLAMDLALYDGRQYLKDPLIPMGKARPIGDNADDRKTWLKCYPSEPFNPEGWRALLHSWDTTDVQPGVHELSITVGQVRQTITVRVP